MKKKSLLAALLSVGLLGSIIPPSAIAADTTTETERKHSLFNAEKYDYLVYDDLKETLETFEKESKRVNLDITGQSASGKDLYTITIADTDNKNSEKQYKKLRKLMSEDPEQAQSYLKANPDVKAPILIHASIHGSEFVGTDAAIRLIERFGFENDRETKGILEDFTLIINVNANPDGRIDATRFNSEGIDLNRDFVTQSQPETQAVVEQISELNPLVLLDLHGYVKQRGKANHPGLILPGTPPHNPNYETDLLYNWMNQQAEAMEAELVSNKAGYETDLYRTMEGTHIPLRDSAAGWDVYPPIYTPAYAMLHGAYGYTLEAPANDLDGVKWQVDAVTGALKFAAEHKEEMLHDQIEVFVRGVNSEHPNNEEGFYPESYVIPADEEDPTAVNKIVDHLLKNDVEVEQAKKSFTVDGENYDAGTYIIDSRQAKAGLVNAFLWDGEDITEDIGSMYDIAAWNLPELWGFESFETDSVIVADTKTVKQVKENGKLIGKGPFLIPNSSVNAVKLVNDLLAQGVPVQKDADGNFYADGKKGDLQQAVKDSGLTLESNLVPENAAPLKTLNVAILKDGGTGKVQSHSGTKLALERLGFNVTEVHPRTVANEGLAGFDAFVYSAGAGLAKVPRREADAEFSLISEEEEGLFKTSLQQFVEGGGHFIAVGAGGSQVAADAGLTSVEVNTGFGSSNGIVKVDYLDSSLTTGYGADDLGFVYGPVWYTGTEDVDVAARFASEDDILLAGHWAGSEIAQGEAVIVQEKEQPVTLIGIEAGFRNHTDYLFRLLSNTIFD